MVAEPEKESQKTNAFAYFINFVPGLVILVFSVLALYSSVEIANSPDAANAHGFDINKWVLYLSVLAVGLSGFALAVLNGRKIQALRTANVDKQKNLKILKNRLEAMEATVDGIGIINEEGKLVYMNRALMTLYGIDPSYAEEFKWQPWQAFYHSVDQEVVMTKAVRILKEIGFWRGEVQIEKGEGRIVHTEFSLTALENGGFIHTVRDISDRHKATEEKENLQEQFYQSQKMEAVGRLAGGIAHDFNNILASMNGYAEFLIEDLDEETPQHNFARNILQAGQQARDLVDQMLAFSRRNPGEQDSVDLIKALGDNVSLLRASVPKTITLETDFKLPAAWVKGNISQISQIIMNLCVNASDAIEDERGVISLELNLINAADYRDFGSFSRELPSPEEAPVLRIEDKGAQTTKMYVGTMKSGADYFCLRVQDTGSGMSRVIMERIFEPFFTTKPVDKGTGLGLATIHGVLAAHRGAMIVESTLGQGTEFLLFFPVAEADVVMEDENEGVSGDKLDGRILLVEDQENVREMMTSMLERIGLEAFACESGLEALAVIRENPGDFDIVITDHNMPKMTGLELVQETNLDFPDLPFILMSGYSEQKLQDLMHEHEAIKAVLRKPVARNELVRALRSVIHEGREKTNQKRQASA